MFPLLPIPEYPVIPARPFVTPAEDRLEARRAIRREAAARRYETHRALSARDQAHVDARLGRMQD
jgi:hypothetical protein